MFHFLVRLEFILMSTLRRSKTFFEAIFGKCNEQKRSRLGADFVMLTDKWKRQSARDCLVFISLSRTMILELQKGDQTWLRGKRCLEEASREQKDTRKRLNLKEWSPRATKEQRDLTERQKIWVRTLTVPGVTAYSGPQIPHLLIDLYMSTMEVMDLQR